MPSSTHRLLAAVVGLALLTAACGDDDDAASPTATSVAAPATTATTAPASSTTTTAPPMTGPSSTAPAPTSAPGSPDGAEGSGCAPGTDELPDGRWYGMVVNLSATGFDLDLACWFTGEAAVRAAGEDGEESPPPNDYYVRNTDVRLRSLRVTRPAIRVRWFRDSGDPQTEVETPYDEWVAARTGQPTPGVWVEIDEGEVAAVAEQWVP